MTVMEARSSAAGYTLLRAAFAILWVCAGVSAPAVIAQGSASSEAIVRNDNRRSAGTLADNVLTIRLEARLGEWRPDGEKSPAVAVKAFAAEGGPYSIQFTGRPLGESMLCRIAHAYEQASDWHVRHPNVTTA